jgi:hypothetical protein
MLTLVFHVDPPPPPPARTNIDLQSVFKRITTIWRLFTISAITSPQLEVKKSSRNLSIGLPIGNISLFDFDMNVNDIKRAVYNSAEFVKETLIKKFLDVPYILLPAFVGISGYFEDRFNDSERVKPPHVHVYLARRMGSHRALKIRFCSGGRALHSRFVGDRLIFPSTSHPALAADQGLPALVRSGPYLVTDARRDRYRRRLRWGSAKWCLIVPIPIQPDTRVEDVILVEADRPVEEFGLPPALDLPQWKEPLLFIQRVAEYALRAEGEVLKPPTAR